MDFYVRLAGKTGVENYSDEDTFEILASGVLRITRADERDTIYYSPAAWSEVTDSTHEPHGFL